MRWSGTRGTDWAAAWAAASCLCLRFEALLEAVALFGKEEEDSGTI